jgi:hypothetical protein
LSPTCRFGQAHLQNDCFLQLKQVSLSANCVQPDFCGFVEALGMPTREDKASEKIALEIRHSRRLKHAKRVFV